MRMTTAELPRRRADRSTRGLISHGSARARMSALSRLVESSGLDVPVERKSSLRPLLIQPGSPWIDRYTRRVEINVPLGHS